MESRSGGGGGGGEQLIRVFRGSYDQRLGSTLVQLRGMKIMMNFNDRVQLHGYTQNSFPVQLLALSDRAIYYILYTNHAQTITGHCHSAYLELEAPSF